MTRRRPIRSEVWESEPVWTRALLLRDGDALPMNVSDVGSWGVWVYDMTDYGRVYAVSDQAPSDGYFFDTLQTAGWDGQESGYNFGHALLPADVELLGGHSYRIEYLIDTVSDGNLAIVHETHVLGLFNT